MQGATMDTAEINVGKNIFECGQTYVALSRLTTLEGLFLTDFDPSKIFVDEKVVSFYKTFE
jgi:ATP-dependent DNA helicase PIF1